MTLLGLNVSNANFDDIASGKLNAYYRPDSIFWNEFFKVHPMEDFKIVKFNNCNGTIRYSIISITKNQSGFCIHIGEQLHD
jgi:hypothetical protein